MYSLELPCCWIQVWVVKSHIDWKCWIDKREDPRTWCLKVFDGYVVSRSLGFWTFSPLALPGLPKLPAPTGGIRAMVRLGRGVELGDSDLSLVTWFMLHSIFWILLDCKSTFPMATVFWFTLVIMHIFSINLDTVHTSDWYMEYRLHLCWSINRKASFSWKECGPSIGSDDRSARHSLTGYYITSKHYSYY